MKHSCRAARLLYLIRLLSTRPYRVSELVELCRVHRATIQRDLLELQMEPLRVPLISEDGRWQILR